LTLNILLLPASIVTPAAIPLTPNPVPFAVIEARVRGALPTFASETALVLVWPTWTFENMTSLGEIESEPPQPEPTSLIDKGVGEISVVTVSSPISVREVLGVNRIFSVALPPGAIDAGALPTSVKAEP